MAFTPEQLRILRATDPAIVRKTLEMMSPAQRAEIASALDAEVTAQAKPELMPSHTPSPDTVPSPEFVRPQSPAPGRYGDQYTAGTTLNEVVLGEAPGEPQTTASGLAGAVVRGGSPYAAGAALGAAAGAPAGGAGAVPGALAGMGIVGIQQNIVDPAITMVNQRFGTNFGTMEEFVDNLLTKVGVAQPQTEAERITMAGTKGLAGAAGGVGLGRTMMARGFAPAVQGVGKVLAANPEAQLAGGAGSGAASQYAAERGAGVMGQLGAGLVGGLLGGMAGQRAAGRPVSTTAAAPRSIMDAEKAGVRLMTSDVVPPRTFGAKWIQSTGEKIPLAGTGGPRQAQQAQRIKAVEDLMHDFSVTEPSQASEAVMKDLATKRSSDIVKYATAKNEVIDRLGSSGTVPVDRTIQTIDNEINRLSALKTQEVNPIITRLEDWKNSIQGQNLTNVEMLRKQIGESFKAPELTSVRSVGDRVVGKIYGSLREDMGDFIKANGERRDITKWSVANKRLSGLADELDMGVLKATLKRGDATPEVINNMLFSKKPSEIKQLYKSLTPEGRENAQMAILARVAEDSGGIGMISPDRFVTEVGKRGNSIGVFFEGQDLERVKGLARTLELTKRAGQAGVSPATGVQVAIPVGAAILTDLLGGAGAAMTTGGALGLAARAYESAPVRNLLLRMAKTPKGSKAESALFQQTLNALRAQQNTTEKTENR